MLGFCKLLLGIIFGGTLVGLLKLFPNSILSVMLFISGLEVGSRYPSSVANRLLTDSFLSPLNDSARDSGKISQ
jgi:hypothetical protein